MSNGELQQLEGLANLIDQVAKDCWNASRMNPQARTCEYAAKEIRSLVTKIDATPSSANGAVGEMPIGWIKPRFLESLSNYREAARNPSNFSVAVQAGQHDAEDKPLYTVEQLRAAVLAEREACAAIASRLHDPEIRRITVDLIRARK